MSVDSFIRQSKQQAVSSVLQAGSSALSLAKSQYSRVQAEKDSVQTKFQNEYLEFCQQLPYSLDTDQYSQASENWINSWTNNISSDTNYSSNTRKWVQDEFSIAQKQGSTQKITGIANIANNTRTATLISAKADMLRTNPNISYEEAVNEFTESFNSVQGSSLVGTYNIQTPDMYKEAIKYDKASQAVSSLVMSNYVGEDLNDVEIVKTALKSIPEYKASPMETLNLQAQVSSSIEKIDALYKEQAETINSNLKTQYQSAIFTNNILDINQALEDISTVPVKYRPQILSTLNDMQEHNNDIAFKSFSKGIENGYAVTDESLSIINDEEMVDKLVSQELTFLGKTRFASSQSVESAMDIIKNFNQDDLTITPQQREQAQRDLLDDIKQAQKDVVSIQELDINTYLEPSTTEAVAEKVAPSQQPRGITFSFAPIFTPVKASQVEQTTEQTEQTPSVTEQETPMPTATAPSTSATQVLPSSTETEETEEPIVSEDNFITNVTTEQVQQHKDLLKSKKTTVEEVEPDEEISPTLVPVIKPNKTSLVFSTDNLMFNNANINPDIAKITAYRQIPGASESELQSMVSKQVRLGNLTEEQGETLATLPSYQGEEKTRQEAVNKIITSMSKDLISSKNQTSRDNLTESLRVFFDKQIAENPKLLSDDAQFNVFMNNLQMIATDYSAFTLLKNAQKKGELLDNPKKYLNALSTADPKDIMSSIVSGNFDSFIDNTLQNAYGKDVPDELRSNLYTDEHLRDYFATEMGFSTTDYSYLNDENDPEGIKRLLVEYNVLYAKTERAIGEAFSDTFNDLSFNKKDVEDFNVVQHNGGFYVQDPEVKQLWWKPNQEAFDDKGITNWNYAIADSPSNPTDFIIERNFGEFDSQLAEDLMKLQPTTIGTGTRSSSKKGFIGQIASDMSYSAGQQQQAVYSILKKPTKEKKEATRKQTIIKIFNLRKSLIPQTSGGTTSQMQKM